MLRLLHRLLLASALASALACCTGCCTGCCHGLLSQRRAGYGIVPVAVALVATGCVMFGWIGCNAHEPAKHALQHVRRLKPRSPPSIPFGWTVVSVQR